MKLYSYWRSSCSYRVRIALGLKGLDWQTLPVNLTRAEQRQASYLEHNPSGMVPTLVLEDGSELVQSMAVLDWLEAAYPEPALLPSEPLARAQVLAACHVIVSDTQPATNSGLVNHLKAAHGLSEEEGLDWMRHFMAKGLAAFQNLIPAEGRFAFGDTPGWADICLIPQLYNARRIGIDMRQFPRLTEVEAAACALPAFDAACPEAQPDADAGAD